ncbi:Bifunctional aspartokinase/homoserine dehydrogenase 1 [Buchnera aphidicola (Eriosoma lanigerum)]|uniref:bifunctional aspartate kinase/homoserine dehydrogenase I n=1 Tax=Buchnera aphidicola TaxID=9 RepID=UPI003463A113
MKILKFGGTSLKNANKFLQVSSIIEKNTKKYQVAIVLSAPATITNYLINIIQHVIEKNEIPKYIDDIQNIFFKIIDDIFYQQPNFSYKNIHNLIKDQFVQLKKILHSIQILQICPKNIYAFIISRGEILSIAIMQAILQSKKYNTTIINPVDNLLSNGEILDSVVDISKSSLNIQSLQIPLKNIILMPGFIAGNHKKELVVLGRNGSDYSASVLAVCLNAKKLEIWTDVDGIYTCDPRIISNPFLLQKISYEEAMELSYFGATVLHPKTIFPIMKYKIPCKIKNTNNIKEPGTLISTVDDNIHINLSQQRNIKGITYLDYAVMLIISSTTMDNTELLTKKVLSILARNKIWIILLTQSSSQSNFNFCILEKQLSKTIYILKNELKLELNNHEINPIKFKKKLSIISIIGKDIHFQSNIFSKIFSALSKNNINIHALTKGSSNNSISVVVNQNQKEYCIQAMHTTIFYDTKIIEIFLIGTGGVGKVLLAQLKDQINLLTKKNIQFKICMIANSKKMLQNFNGINLNHWEENLNTSKFTFNFQELITQLKHTYLHNPVIVDCTSSKLISDQYITFLSSGFNIVTSNKKANTNNYHYYQQIRNTALIYGKKFLYETNVGAGLPVIENLKNLLNTGDKLLHFRGILSGSLSFIFGELNENINFSNATYKARKLGFTEPDPRDDLSGLDVARKLLILAREAGYQLELNEIEIESILPSYFNSIPDIQTTMLELKKLDNIFSKKFQQAKKLNKVLRYVGTIHSSGKCQVKIEEIDKNDPLYEIKNGENALAFYSKYYQPIPLVLRGYGAGNNVTAAGVFSDILRTLS